MTVTTLSGTSRTIGSDALPNSQFVNPNWSPDGARIVYQHTDGTSDYEIWTLRASDGADRRQLTNNANEDEYPAYSPDGARITFSRSAFGNYNLYTMSSADDGTTTDENVIVGSPDSELAPDWGSVAPPAAPGCTMSGTFAADFIFGTAGNDTICSLGGNDTIKGEGGRDELSGFLGSDRLFGGGGRDRLDSRDGVNGNDSLNGGPGRDRCLKDRREAAVRSCP